MKSPVLLAAAALLALMSKVLLVESGELSGSGFYPPPPDEGRASWDGDWIPYSGEADRYAGNAAYPEDGVPWVKDPYRVPTPNRYDEPARAPWDWNPGYGDSPAAPIVAPQRRYPDAPGGGLPADRYPLPPGTFRELPPQFQPEYRFRGDERPGFGGAAWQDGFRFRPLTDEERGRSGYDGNWRPIEPERTLRGSPGPDALPPDEAFGYQPDRWFRRYYGDRP